MINEILEIAKDLSFLLTIIITSTVILYAIADFYYEPLMEVYDEC